MTEELQKKVDFAIKLLQAAEKKAAEVDQPVEICYSGGKDSDVILELAKMAGINYRAIYKNTTIDPPGTIKHAKENGVEILHPNITFLNLVRKKGMPTRFTRFCCSVLKEYKVLDYAVVGVRKDESVARARRYNEPERCRVFNSKEKCRHYMPILYWTKDDVAEFIEERGIKCHPLYYDEDGSFHVERRLGCIGCPMSTHNGRDSFLQYPKLLRSAIIAENDYLQNHPDSKAKKKFGDAYNLFFCNLFCNSNYMEYCYKLQPDIWGGRLDCKEYLENYFNIKLDI